MMEAIICEVTATDKVGIVYHSFYLDHDPGQHVESPLRLQAIMAALHQQKLVEKLVPLSPMPASLEQLLLVHRPGLVQRLKGLAQSGGGAIDLDTVMSAGSFRAALMAVGGAIRAAEAVLEGEVDSAFALVRPPGHHATPAEAMGFCLFNNVAVAAAHLLHQGRAERILIVDFDAHHGNGTQAAFYADPRVLYFSVHQFPWFPGSGDVDEIGIGAGRGYTVNLPLPAGCGDAAHLRAFQEILIPAARRFGPQLILVSAGYDAHLADPLSLQRVTTPGYANLVATLKGMAQELCQGRLAMVLEGGYNLNALAASVATSFEVLLGAEVDMTLVGPDPYRDRSVMAEQVIGAAKAMHSL